MATNTDKQVETTLPKPFVLKLSRVEAGHYQATVNECKVKVYRTYHDNSTEVLWMIDIDGPGYNNGFGEVFNSADYLSDYFYSKKEAVEWFEKWHYNTPGISNVD